MGRMSESPIEPQPPVAAKVPVHRTHHGDTFVDDYEWLREKENPEVIAHLETENSYAEAVTAGQQELRDSIFAEIKERTEETDLSVPARKRGWWYFSRTAEGQQYAVHCRVAATDTGDPAADWTPPVIEAGKPFGGEQVLIDGNAEAAGQPFFALGGLAVTEDGNLLAYAQDNAGDERFTLRIKNLTTGELLPDVIENVFYGLAFSPDGTRVYYTVVDDSWRPNQIKAHTLGQDPSGDVVVLQEDDPGMWMGFDLSPDQQELLISIGNSEYAETHSLDLVDPLAAPRLLLGREAHILHGMDPVTVDGERAYLLTHNLDAENNMVSLVAADEFSKPLADQEWATVFAHREDVKIEGTAVTATHAMVSVRQDTIERIQVLPLAGLGTEAQTAVTEPDFDEELYTCSLAGAEYDSPVIRLVYTSFLVPPRIYDYTLDSGELSLRKETPVKGGYNAGDYVAEREWATAADGTRIPLSVIRRREISRDGSNPALVYGYGSYEMSMDPGFSIPRLSLLDRGVVFVIAHVRGGGELGRHWYDDGKKLEKKNSFTDFITATEHVVATGWAHPRRVVAMGGSAGGLLMGAIANLAPQLYSAIVAQVPFVDALTSILDPELPLSALEWEEWGNPITDADVYAYMKSYTPYENIAAVQYPKIAAVTSLNDTRVLYVEPAKWVQRLRDISTGSEPIVLKIEMDGGHGGASGRYEAWKDRAWDYAFALDALGATERI